MKVWVGDWTMDYLAKLIYHRRNLHRIPELGFQEYKTKQYIVDNLSGFVDRIEFMAGTGVVGYLDNKQDTTVLIRADMDALPIHEENDVEYKSVHDGVMHACGHDAHMSILLVLAEYFYVHRDKLKVNLKYMFQPAEEGKGGALKMIEEGVLSGVNYALALHVWNELEVGKIALSYGSCMASADSFEIEIIGQGAHAATPNLSKDPILASVNLISQTYHLFPRIFKDFVITFTSISAESVSNIIPDRCKLRGTVRCFDENVRKQIATRFEGLIKDICSLNQTRYVLRYEFGYPVLVNDKWLYDRGVEVASKVVGRDNITEFRTYGAEDMAFVFQKVPGLYVAIGSGKGYPHHSPRFDINEQSLLIGFRFMKGMVWRISGIEMEE